MRLFFATDIHGSDLCFRKFLRAATFYDVEALFLGGDYSSKSLIACRRSGGHWRAMLGHEDVEILTRGDLEQFKRKCGNLGHLVVELDEAQFESFKNDDEFKKSLFESAQRERLQQWTDMATENFRSTSVRIYHIPGNDEPSYCDEFFNDLPFVPLNRQHVRITPNLTILGIGGSNPTPWHTPREYEETRMSEIIDETVDYQLIDLPMIFFGHVPPFESGLGNAPALNSDLSYKLVFGSYKKEPVGSSAIRRAIEQLQPVIGLFGHVHESQAETRIGKTLCVNPGSSYHSGCLKGCIVTIKNDHASVQFTEG